MKDGRLRLVAGLGNPGSDYEKTRHNAGFIAVDELAAAFSIGLEKKKFNCVFGRGKIEGIDTVIAKPMSFMNLSGDPLVRLAGFFKILSEDMIIVHDDIDLTMGRLKIKWKGGHGGHNGVRSVVESFGDGDFVRVKIGIGRGEGEKGDRNRVTNHVLGKFRSHEITAFDKAVAAANDAVKTILTKGPKIAMNQFNSNSFDI